MSVTSISNENDKDNLLMVFILYSSIPILAPYYRTIRGDMLPNTLTLVLIIPSNFE